MPLTCDKPEAFFIRTRARITYYNKVQEKNGWVQKKMSKGKNLNSPANCVDTWIRTKDPHHVKVIL